MEKLKNNITKLSYIFLAVNLLSAMLLILNIMIIQSVVVQYVGLVGIGLSVGFVMFEMTICLHYFVKGFKDMVNHGWL